MLAIFHVVLFELGDSVEKHIWFNMGRDDVPAHKWVWRWERDRLHITRDAWVVAASTTTTTKSWKNTKARDMTIDRWNYLIACGLVLF